MDGYDNTAPRHELSLVRAISYNGSVARRYRDRSMNVLIHRPTQIAVGLFFVLIVSALAIQVLLNARGQTHLEEIRATLQGVAATQRVGLKLMRMLSYDLSEEWPLDVVELEGVTTDLASEVTKFARHREGQNIAKLEEAVEVLRRPTSDRRAATAASLYTIREALHGETLVVSEVLGEVETSMRTESRLAITALLLLSLLVLSVLWLLYRRVFRPLDTLKRLLLRLADGRFEPVDTTRIDGLVQPLFQNYNQMVRRLEELERLHRQHAGSLEEQVRSATQTLLQQQQSLARAERLAAVGELSAQVAHELRNPLAGMHMALMNLRRESQDADVVERLDLVIAELQRVTRLLNELLNRSRHIPEPRRRVQVAKLIGELVQLVRYQVPSQIELDAESPAAIECELPPNGLRQAVLNLVLNAVHALGERSGTILLGACIKDGKLNVTVRDDGPGFPATLLEGGVRPFATESENGTGLGLTIAQRFARDLEGELRLSNIKPAGALAELILPCKPARG
jgi:C4-dicarboxylate-specific signal transduction histidine kinase